MATNFTRVLFGMMRDVTLPKLNAGLLAQTVSKDLVEFGQHGVQGLVVKTDTALALVKKYASATNVADLYCILGTAKGHLVMTIHDKKKTSWEAGPATVVKDYDKIHKALAANTATVQDISPAAHRDDTIDKATRAQADRFGADALEDDAFVDTGGITGNVVLCAHGTPKVLPGRVIGSMLGKKSPEQIVAMLIDNPDPKQRLSKSYDGKITLSGCYTAAGGPEEDKQDDVFAKKVHDILVSKGYKKASVVGMPGPSWTAQGTGRTDASGDVVARGEKAVYPVMAETARGVQALRLQIDQLTEGLIAAAEKSTEQEKFYATPGALAVLKKIEALEKEMAEVANRVDTNQRRDIKGLVGTFGLRQIKTKFKGKLFG